MVQTTSMGNRTSFSIFIKTYTMLSFLFFGKTGAPAYLILKVAKEKINFNVYHLAVDSCDNYHAKARCLCALEVAFTNHM